MMMQCVKQQQQSQESMVKLVSKLVKEKETTVPHTTATTSTHTHVGNAERSHTLARQPEATPAATRESSGTCITFNGAPAEEDDGGIDGTYGDAYENFTARGGTAYGSSTFPAARGGFTRGRGGTPHMTSTYASHTATPHTGQFTLPEPEAFKGDIQDWPRFWEEWTHYVSQTMPDDISKCRLLKKLLQGSVRDIIQCYRDTSADYKNLSEALKKRFDKPGAVRSCLRRKLADIPRQERESPAALRAFFTQIEAVLRQLKDVGEDTEHYSFVDMVELKLGPRLSAHVIPQKRTCKLEEWTVTKLLTLVENYVLDAEEIAINREVTSSQTLTKEKDGRDHHAKRVNTLQTHSNPYEEEIPVGFELEPEAKQSPARQPPAPEVNPAAVFLIQHVWPKELLGKRSCPPQMGQRPSRSSNRQPDRVQKPCLFCLLSGQSTTAHRSSACTKYSTWLQRRDLLESKDHYIRCLQPHTKRDDCPKRKLSDQCWQKCHAQKDKLGNLIRSPRNHHALLCSVRYPDPKDKKHVNWVKQNESTKGYSSDESDHSAIDTAPQLFADYGDEPPTDSEDEGPYISMSVTQKEETTMAIGAHKRTLMMTAMVDVSNASDASLKQPSAIFFDTGSSDTLITKELASQLGRRGGRNLQQTASAPLTEGAIEKALTRPRLAVLTTSVQPQVLIGIDQQHLFRLVPRSESLPNGFAVWDSSLGPILCGRGEAEPQNKAETVQTVDLVFGTTRPEAPTKVPVRSNAVSVIVSKSPELQAIESMASLEGIGIESLEKVNEEELILERHRESLNRLENGRYEVSFPFRDEILELLRVGKHPRHILPTNYGPALARLNSVWQTHLRDNPQSREAYSNTFELQLSLKIIEKVSNMDDKGLPWLVHYLAHHPVLRADKPTQLRIVFDGSRAAEILIIGDIEKAFLQIGLRLEDRDVTRFLWLKDPSKPPTQENLVVYRYCRIPFGLNSSPFLLLATIDHHLRQVGSTVSSEVRLNTYSDNVFLLAHTPEEGVAKYNEAKLIFSEMKMNIREFISNDSQFSEAIPQEDRAKQTKESTLGHEWDSQRDVWVFRLPEPNPFKRAQETCTESSNGEGTTTPAPAEQTVMVSRKVKTAKFLTKRVLLSILHALWDPLGYFGPLTLQARLVHQELWALDAKLKWDAPVPEPITKAWEAATASWSGVSFEIQRHLFSERRPASLQLHVFVDASADGYGGVAYLRVKTADSTAYTRIVYAKNRVKSRKPVLTIPRKELMAALIGCRMVTFLRKELLPELKRLH
ncbi:Pao retrotransposon peptidase domain-containing protein, partial [Aphelenchoides avenae]